MDLETRDGRFITLINFLVHSLCRASRVDDSGGRSGGFGGHTGGFDAQIMPQIHFLGVDVASHLSPKVGVSAPQLSQARAACLDFQVLKTAISSLQPRLIFHFHLVF